MSPLPPPKGETTWASFYDSDGDLRFMITSKPDREFYILYMVEGGKLKKMGRAREPTNLVSKYKVDEQIGAGG